MLADDFAPQLPADELAALASSIAADRPVVVLGRGAGAAGRAPTRDRSARASTLMLRELVVLVRRSLRGTDAVALAGDELLVMIDGPMLVAQPIAARLLAAVRTHRFTGGATDRPIRLTLSLGAAAAPEHGDDFDQLVARRAPRAGRSGRGQRGVRARARRRPASTSSGSSGARSRWRGSPSRSTTWCAAWRASSP